MDKKWPITTGSMRSATYSKSRGKLQFANPHPADPATHVIFTTTNVLNLHHPLNKIM
jgi:hypothetical protein